jgi:hypothetical protein
VRKAVEELSSKVCWTNEEKKENQKGMKSDAADLRKKIEKLIQMVSESERLVQDII